VDAARLLGSLVVGSLLEVVPHVAPLLGRLAALASGVHSRELGRLIEARIDIGAELLWTAGSVESHGWCFAKIGSSLGLDLKASRAECWSKLGNRGLCEGHSGDRGDTAVSARYLGDDGEAGFLASRRGRE